MSKIYPGTSAFFANRQGTHNWLDNHERPFLSVITTNKKGRKKYDDLFLNKDKSITVQVTDDGNVVISFPKDTKQPLFRVLHRS